jgi:hypothetical protein
LYGLRQRQKRVASVPGEIFPGRFTDGKNWVDYIPGVAKAFGLNIPAVTAYLQDRQNDKR